MKLSVMERIVLLQLLPEKGSFTNLKLVREAKEELSFSEKEHKDFKIKVDENGRVIWSEPPNSEKEIKFGEIVSGILKRALKELDEKEVLEEKHFSVYEKFIE